jgi:hypothetical protein
VHEIQVWRKSESESDDGEAILLIGGPMITHSLTHSLHSLTASARPKSL